MAQQLPGPLTGKGSLSIKCLVYLFHNFFHDVDRECGRGTFVHLPYTKFGCFFFPFN